MNKFLYETARQLISIDTVSAHSDRPAADLIANLLERAHFRVSVQQIEVDGVAQANVFGWAGPPVRDGLIISGHIDTVPFQGQPGWTRDPLRMEVEAERIYGRGTSDMKGFLAQCIAGVSEFDLRSLRRPLVFVFTADEEVGCIGAEKASVELPTILGETPMPRLAWIGEPTSWDICHAHKSIVGFEVVVRGRGGHSGAPAQGVNAIAVMGKVMEVIGRLQHERAASPDPKFADVFPESPCDVLNFGTISGGMAVNMIAEQCKLRVSYRTLPDTDPLELYREIERRVTEIDAHDWAHGRYRASIEIGAPMVVPPLLARRDTALERALFGVTGAKGTRGAVFGTDAGWFGQAGITSLICGPGDLDQAHQPDESIRRDAFDRGPAMIRKVIERMCCAS